MSMKKSFVIYSEWIKAFEEFPDKERLELYDAVMGYMMAGTERDLSPLAKMAFCVIKDKIDADDRRRRKHAEYAKEYRNKQRSTVTTVNVQQKNEAPSVELAETKKEHSCTKQTASEEPCLDDKQKENEFDRLGFVTDEAYKGILQTWLAYKRNRRESYKSQLSLKALYTKLINLSSGDPKVAQAIVEQSMANNWAGLFELDRYGRRQKQNDSMSPSMKLGPGEYIDKEGRRTYGSGQHTIPINAPPRPSERWAWVEHLQQWTLY